MNLDDYVLPSQTGSTQLLDFDGFPEPDLKTDAERVMAAFATLVHRNVDVLSPEQLEQVVVWVKHAKCQKQAVPIRSIDEFERRIDFIRNSGIVKDLERRAYRTSLSARALGAVVGIAAVAGLLLLIGGGTGEGVVALGIAIAALFGSDVVAKEAIVISKEQEQRHLWACIRDALTVEELNKAGFFAYLRDAEIGSPQWSEQGAVASMREESERISDALYRDPRGYLADWRR